MVRLVGVVVRYRSVTWLLLGALATDGGLRLSRSTLRGTVLRRLRVRGRREPGVDGRLLRSRQALHVIVTQRVPATEARLLRVRFVEALKVY